MTNQPNMFSEVSLLFTIILISSHSNDFLEFSWAPFYKAIRILKSHDGLLTRSKILNLRYVNEVFFFSVFFLLRFFRFFFFVFFY